ncbi:hypothetical protein XA68_14785 [Ophiocordyceps unilateralis]|uniref:Uncharacterized protein n=1 Tax=Ophiocordyceps unilateralis TaxID=268505 RepID=A0A2A9P9L3_OPHUN|nr:hypothetical protein XA68_14785 [Ophiocordyceps unilateralis]
MKERVVGGREKDDEWRFVDDDGGRADAAVDAAQVQRSAGRTAAGRYRRDGQESQASEPETTSDEERMRAMRRGGGG